MRIPCPICGSRDRREFYVAGNSVLRDRPDDAEWSPAWDAYLHLRDNPAGPTRELWFHEAGCGAWLIVDRDTLSHAVGSADLALDVVERQP